MMLASNAATPAHPVRAVVVAEALDDVAVLVFECDVDVGDEDEGADEDVGGVPLDPVNAALTAWSYLPFAITHRQRHPVHTLSR